jgi:hypothetical protein
MITEMWNIILSIYTKLHILWVAIHNYVHNLLAPHNSPGRRTIIIYGDDYAVRRFIAHSLTLSTYAHINSLDEVTGALRVRNRV